MGNGLYGLIQQKISNSVVLGACSFLSLRISFLRKLLFGRTSAKHLEENARVFVIPASGRKTQGVPETYSSTKKYSSENPQDLQVSNYLVENQNALGHLHFGKTNMAYAGCEIIALYNALLVVNAGHAKHYSLPELISFFEMRGMMLGGRWGTSPKALYRFLKEQGYEVVSTAKKEEFDSLGEESRVLLLTMYNDRTDIRKQIHTICITKEGGKYTAHNAYCNGKIIGPFPSISKLIGSIREGKAQGIFLIGVKG